MVLNLQNFTSLFEILTALSILYSLVDEFMRNKFVSADNIVLTFRVKLSTVQNSLSQIRNRKIYPSEKEQLKQENNLKEIETFFEKRANQLTGRVRSEHESSKSLSNFYIPFFTLYCIICLFFAGIYSEADTMSTKAAIDTCLSIIVIAFFITTICMTILSAFSLSSINKLLKNKFKTYLFAVCLSFIFVIISTIIFYQQYIVKSFIDPFLHNGFIIICVLMPILAPILYAIKYIRKTNIPIEVNDFENMLSENCRYLFQEIYDYIGFVSYVNGNFGDMGQEFSET